MLDNTLEPIVSCRGLTKMYSHVPALSNLTIDLPKGRIIGLLGPNGSGKTTLIKLITGLIHQSSGELTVGGMPVGVGSKKIVSYLPDRDFLPNGMRSRDLLMLYSDFYEDFDINKCMEMLTRLGIDLNQKFRSMSKGTREKVQLALIMSRNAEFSFLDEPIAAVDPAAREFILTTIISNYKEGSSVLISTHLITDIEPVLDDAVMLQNGVLRIADSVKNIREQANMTVDQLFREVYRC